MKNSVQTKMYKCLEARQCNSVEVNGNKDQVLHSCFFHFSLAHFSFRFYPFYIKNFHKMIVNTSTA